MYIPIGSIELTSDDRPPGTDVADNRKVRHNFNDAGYASYEVPEVTFQPESTNLKRKLSPETAQELAQKKYDLVSLQSEYTHSLLRDILWQSTASVDQPSGSDTGVPVQKRIRLQVCQERKRMRLVRDFDDEQRKKQIRDTELIHQYTAEASIQANKRIKWSEVSDQDKVLENLSTSIRQYSLCLQI